MSIYCVSRPVGSYIREQIQNLVSESSLRIFLSVCRMKIGNDTVNTRHTGLCPTNWKDTESKEYIFYSIIIVDRVS